MKKLFFVVAVLVLGVALVAAAFGNTETASGVGPAVAAYFPPDNVKMVQFHFESTENVDVFTVDGVSYKASCKWYADWNRYWCHSSQLVPVYPYMIVEAGTGAFWWLDAMTYYKRWNVMLPEIHRCCFTPPPPGATNTPIPTDQIPFDVQQFVVMTLTPEP